MQNKFNTLINGLKCYIDQFKKISNIENDVGYITKKDIQNVSSDWNTISNKPFYSEVIDGYIMTEQTFSVVRVDSDKYVMSLDDIRLSGKVELGSKYTVVYDGIEYTATLYEDDGGCYLGINFYYPSYNNPDSLPFGFWFNPSGDTIRLLCASTSGEHTYAIKGKQEIVHTLDEKYLPTSITENLQTIEKDLNTLEQNLNQGLNTLEQNLNQGLNTLEQELDTAKMDKSNPIGTGTFSMNRAQDSTIGDYSSAIGNGVASIGRSSFVCGEFNKDKYIYKSRFHEYVSGEILFPKDGTFYYSSGYTFDEETGIYTLIAPISVHASKLSTINKVGNYFVVEGKYLPTDCVSGSELRSFIYQYDDGYKKYSTTFGTYNNNYNKINNTSALRVNECIENSERSRYAHIVGNGSDDSNRSNAHTLDWKGNAWYAGDVYVGSTSGANKDDGSEKLAKMSDLPACIDKTLFWGQSTAINQDWSINKYFKPNTEYLVIFNGVEYYITTNNYGGTEESDKYPFYFASTDDGCALCPTNTEEEYTYVIYEVKEFRQIDERLIPDSIARTDNIVLTSPNGTKYKLIVADDGTLSTTTV